MDSTPPSPDDFKSLRRLLALKRYEKPPPGFFEDFSARVMARIEAEEQMRARSWLDQLRDLFQAGRLLSGANLVTATGFAFMGAGLFLVLNPRSTQQNIHSDPVVIIQQPENPGILNRVAWEPYTKLGLEPAQETSSEEVPKDLFMLPRMGSALPTRVDTPNLLISPWIYSTSSPAFRPSPRR